jgi:hypothetical protein
MVGFHTAEVPHFLILKMQNVSYDTRRLPGAGGHGNSRRRGGAASQTVHACGEKRESADNAEG